MRIFGKKKQENADDRRNHPLLGEMKHIGVTWKLMEKMAVVLWDEVYHVDVCLYARMVQEGVSEAQENAVQQLNAVLIEKRAQLEAAVRAYANTTAKQLLCERCVPRYIEVGRNGECALFVEDRAEAGAYNDDTETAFALFLLPKVQLFPAEDSLDFLHGRDGSISQEMLYGESAAALPWENGKS